MEQNNINHEPVEVGLDDDIRNKVSFITFIIPAFARAYKMNVQKAYFYLKEFGGMDFFATTLVDIARRESFWAVRSLFDVCFKNGGRIEQYHYEGISRQ